MDDNAAALQSRAVVTRQQTFGVSSSASIRLKSNYHKSRRPVYHTVNWLYNLTTTTIIIMTTTTAVALVARVITYMGTPKLPPWWSAAAPPPSLLLFSWGSRDGATPPW